MRDAGPSVREAEGAGRGRFEFLRRKIQTKFKSHGLTNRPAKLKVNVIPTFMESFLRNAPPRGGRPESRSRPRLGQGEGPDDPDRIGGKEARAARAPNSFIDEFIACADSYS
jgi:hypothetical protein